MGFFDVHCAYSGVALAIDTQVVLLAKHESGWKPFAAPFRGTYDRLGGVDEPKEEDTVFNAFLQWAEEHFKTDDLEEVLECMRDGEPRWNEHAVSYALVDGRVYDALSGDLTQADPKLPEALQKAWKTALGDIEPVDVDDADQYTGLSGESGCQARVDAALKRFATDPLMVAAIEGNVSDWRELDDEDED